MLSIILPMAVIILLFISIAIYNYNTRESFENNDSMEGELNRIKSRIKIKPEEEHRVKRMF